MAKWEYLTVTLRYYKGEVVVRRPERLQNKELSELGDDGWEAVASLRIDGEDLLLLKRPVF